MFSEGAATPVEEAVEDKQDGSGNESEVDDIELIFTTHESKDMSMNLQVSASLVQKYLGQQDKVAFPLRQTRVVMSGAKL